MTGLLIILITGLAAHATLLGDFFHDLWISSNHAFFPVGLLIAGWLLWTRRQELLEVDLPADDSAEDAVAQLRRTRGNLGTTSIGIIISLALVFTSQLLHTPHLGWMSLLILIGAIAYSEYGARGLYGVLPVLILLFFLKPVPGFFEPWLQLGLQWIATRLASMFLDFLRIFNYYEGVVLGLVDQDRLADPICAGVRWLYVAMFAAVAWGIYRSYHWFRIFLNVTQSIFWVVVWNAVRIAVVLINQDGGGNWIDTPLALTLIDFVCLALILFFTWSGDQLFASIAIPSADETATIPRQNDGLAEKLSPAWQPSPWVWGLGFGFAFVALISLRLLALHGSSWTTASNDSSQTEVVLPAEVNGWTIKALEDEKRTLYGGNISTVNRWLLEREGKQLSLEVDSPLPIYPGPRWRWNWYGWTTDDEGNSNAAQSEGSKRSPATIRLSRLPGEAGAVVGSGLDLDGHLVSDRELSECVPDSLSAWTSALQYALGIGSLEAARSHTHRYPAKSIALIWKSAKPLEPEQLKQLSDVFQSILPNWAGRSE